MTKQISNDELQRCFYSTDQFWDLIYRVGKHRTSPLSRQKILKVAADEYMFSRGIVDKDGKEIAGWEKRIGPTTKKMDVNVQRRASSIL